MTTLEDSIREAIKQRSPVHIVPSQQRDLAHIAAEAARRWYIVEPVTERVLLTTLVEALARTMDAEPAALLEQAFAIRDAIDQANWIVIDEERLGQS